MKANILKIAFLLLISLTFQSCDDDEAPTMLTASNFSADIAENSAKGTSLGTVNASANQGDLVYSIVSQNVSGAVEINSTSGELAIADASAFDFETNTSVSGKIKLKVEDVEKEINFTININDVLEDSILANLTSSKTAYENANDGDWIAIDSAEYSNLERNIESLNYGGLNDSQFINKGVNGISDQDLFVTLTGSEILPMPANSYVFAFKYVRNRSFQSVNAQIKISEKDSISGFSNLGTVLPTAEGSVTSTHYFVLKRNQKKATKRSFIGIHTTNNTLSFARISDDIRINYNFGDASTSTATASSVGDALFQALSTTKKQW